jgi:hypothetical protein
MKSIVCCIGLCTQGDWAEELRLVVGGDRAAIREILVFAPTTVPRELLLGGQRFSQRQVMLVESYIVLVPGT